jgi:general secretion pathway protein A
MYTSFFGLKEKPFNLTPSSRHLYLGEGHKEVLALLTYGVRERKGFVLLTGEVGTGKTTMIRAFLENLDEKTRTVYLSNPVLSVPDFFGYLALTALGEKSVAASKAEFLVKFEAFLKRCRLTGEVFLLVVDEAHKLSYDVMEEIRLLSNMEADDEKLINICLVGQPELNSRLMEPRCLPLQQRIAVRYHIPPLDLEGTAGYLAVRLKTAGLEDVRSLFTDEATETIFHYSGGYPRLINILADNAMLLGYSRGEKQITPYMIRESSETMMLPGFSVEMKTGATRRMGEKTADGAVHWGSL